jgi:hypothetical protein
MLNACNDIGLAVKNVETKYMEVGHHRGLVANEHITVGSNLNVKVKTFKFTGEWNVDLEQESHAIFKSKHFCLFYFTQRIWK